jgi:hypothetical protein
MEIFLTLLVLFIGSIVYAIYKSKQRKPKSSEDFIIAEEKKDAKSGELVVKLSLVPGAINELANQLSEPEIITSNHLIKQEELKIDKSKEYILRKKIYRIYFKKKNL